MKLVFLSRLTLAVTFYVMFSGVPGGWIPSAGLAYFIAGKWWALLLCWVDLLLTVTTNPIGLVGVGSVGSFARYVPVWYVPVWLSVIVAPFYMAILGVISGRNLFKKRLARRLVPVMRRLPE